MTYVTSPIVNVDYADDALKSVRRWIHTAYPDVKILLQRDEGSFTRPSFMLSYASPIAPMNMSSRIWESDRILRLSYFGVSKLDCERIVSFFEYDLQNKHRIIPHILFNWAYPSSSVREIILQGTTLNGTLYVRIEGENILNEWSMASEPVSIAVSLDNAVQVMIPMVGGSTGYFKRFRIFAGLSPTTCHLVAEIAASQNAQVTQYTLTALNTTGAAPRESSELHYGFLKPRYTEGNFKEDIVDKGLWEAYMNIEICFPNLRMLEQHVPMVAVQSVIQEL